MAAANGKRRERRERLKVRLEQEGALDEICDFVASGGNLHALAVDWAVKYRHLYNWLHDEAFPERAQQLAAANIIRDNLQVETILGQLHAIGSIDIRKAYDKTGRLLPIHELPDEIAKSIASIDVMVDAKGDVVRKIRVMDRGGMLALNAKRLRMIVDRTELTGADGGPIETTDARAKLLGRLVSPDESE